MRIDIPILLLFSCAIAVLIFSSCESSSTRADLIIHNAKVYTVDSEKTVHQALAVKGNLIEKVGSNEEVLPFRGPDTEVIDAGGAFVLPGLIEGHGHFSGLGNSLMNLNFLRSRSWDEIVAMVADKVGESEEGEWIVGRGWHQEKWEQRPDDHIHGYPRHFDLSEISPENPVMLVHASGHGLFANKKAMDMAGVTKETPNPQGGEIVRDLTGEAIGMFEERAASVIRRAYGQYLDGLSEEERTAQWYKGIELAQEECLKKGVTSFQDAGSSFTEIERYKALAEDGKFDLRLWAMLRHSSEQMRGKTDPYRIIDAGGKFFTCRAIKSELDGALGSFGAWLLEPYNDKEAFYGQNTTSVEEVKAIAQIAMDGDMQLCVHAIGDRANRETLDIFEEVLKANNASDLRWRIEHAQHIHPDDIPRFAELGVIASMQGIHCTSDAPFVEMRLGEKRAREGAYNWRALVDAGAVVTNGTDAPVEDVNPIESFYATVTRKRIDNGMAFFTENALSREEAIYSYTMANAYAAFEENDKGSLEPGKLADIVVLSKDWTTCTDAEILDTEVLYTIVGGEVRYAKG